VYDASEDRVVSVYYTTMTNPGYDIGYPPNLLPIAAYTESTDETCVYGEFPSYDFLPGEYEVTLTVTDNDGDTATDVTIVNIVAENIPPVADAGEDYFEQAQDGYAEVTLEGSGSYDMDGNIVSYYWNWDGDGVVIFPRPWTSVVYTNSTIAYGIVTIDGDPAGAGDQVAAFVGNECRGVADVTLDNAARFSTRNKRDLVSRVTLNIQGESVEQVQFAVWDSSNDQVYSVGNTYMTDPGGDIGYPPDELQINASSFARTRITAIGEIVTVVFPIGIYNVYLTVTDDSGATDTDDALGAVRNGSPVDLVFPNQGDGDVGTLVIPNSVGLINGSKHEENGKVFIDYLLQESTIEELIELGWFQLSISDKLLIHDELKPFLPKSGKLKVIDVTFEEIYKMTETSSKEMNDLFLD
jgi:hypothetical protein